MAGELNDRGLQVFRGREESPTPENDVQAHEPLYDRLGNAATAAEWLRCAIDQRWRENTTPQYSYRMRAKINGGSTSSNAGLTPN